MATYPSALKTFTPIPVAGTALVTDHRLVHQEAVDELAAVQAELGTDPSDTYATVKARLDATTGATYPVVTASASGTYAVPLAPAVVLTMTGATTLTLPAPTQGATILLKVTGAYALTWPASVASPPAYTAGARYAVTTDDGGVTWDAVKVSA